MSGHKFKNVLFYFIRKIRCKLKEQMCITKLPHVDNRENAIREIVLCRYRHRRPNRETDIVRYDSEPIKGIICKMQSYRRIKQKRK